MSDTYIQNLKVGETTCDGYTISDILLKNNYIIGYKDKDGVIGFEYFIPDNDNDKSVPIIKDKYYELKSKIPFNIPEQLHSDLEEDLIKSFVRAIHTSVIDSEDSTSWCKNFTHIEKRIKNTFSKEKINTIYSYTSILLGITLFTILMICSTNLEIEKVKNLDMLFVYSAFAVFGATFSIIEKSEIASFEIEKKYLIADVLIRLLFGLFSAVILYFAIKAKFIFGFADENTDIIKILSFIAGFSERFVPTILRNITREVQTKEKNTK